MTDLPGRIAILSPQAQGNGQIVTLSIAGAKKKVWRKQILPLGSINYDGRQIKFDSDYHKELVRSFRDGAYDQVPFQLADPSNNHNNDPARTKGELVDLRAEPTGLYGYFKMADPSVVLGNRRLGVSCRILENYTREHDGKKFGRALQHVLGTLDPRITGMRPWESVDLSNEPDPDSAPYMVDLSNHFYTAEVGEMSGTTVDTEEKQVVELTTAQLDRLNAMLAQDDEDQQVIAGLNPEDFEDSADDEEETEEDDNDEIGELDQDEYTDGGDDSVALAQIRDLQSRVTELTNSRQADAVRFETSQLASTGLAPAIIEAATPLLAARSGVVELSNGKGNTSVASQTRTLLRTILELSNKGIALVDFDREQGTLVDGNSSVQAQRAEYLKQMEEQYGR